ncbi:DUF2635 domain-containing protein [Pseudomonas gingeri]|uniref:DUF2635 domain-containing protein n=1 Tax=Pseudomonas gingeri TaxID=117681 RepID=UPI0015A42665|nr:DUF2635 domain-containing protein [Pseudomonas gingeri]NWA24054.1 DUF2635 domain-containing protein [Pseudomonas gingeri]
MRIYASPGLLVRDPVKRDFLPSEGREVPDDDLYWLRRLSCGDATLTQPDEISVEPKAPAKNTPTQPSAEPPETHEGSDSQ